MIRQRLRGVVVMLARRRPLLLYGAVGRFAQFTAPLARRRDWAARLRRLYPHLTRAEARAAAADLRSGILKSRAAGVAVTHAGGEALWPPMAGAEAAGALRGPAILATYHCGALSALGGVLRHLPGEVLAVHRMEWKLPGNVTGIFIEGGGTGDAAAFYRALATVRRGGYAFLVVEGRGIEVSLLGHTTTLRRGAFALARMSGVPIVPIFARWTGARATITVGEPIGPSDDEAAMAQAMAQALERHMLDHPAEISAVWLEVLTR